jgi:hypothetical protein
MPAYASPAFGHQWLPDGLAAFFLTSGKIPFFPPLPLVPGHAGGFVKRLGFRWGNSMDLVPRGFARRLSLPRRQRPCPHPTMVLEAVYEQDFLPFRMASVQDTGPGF